MLKQIKKVISVHIPPFTKPKKGQTQAIDEVIKETEKGVLISVPIVDHLRRILEHTHNRYTFDYRCKGLKIIIEKMPEISIMAYYSDDRDGSITTDTAQPPFDQILRFS
jgi:hypothetical protein